MAMPRNHGALLSYLAQKINLLPQPLPRKRAPIEEHRCLERHERVLCVLWLMNDLPERLRECWGERMVLYNQVLKDFHEVPVWFHDLTNSLGVRLPRR